VPWEEKKLVKIITVLTNHLDESFTYVKDKVSPLYQLKIRVF
jgi:hypothetical protein